MFKLLIILHLLGASIWVGGHLVLALIILPKVLQQRSPEMLLEFESRFEKIGMPALITQVVTGVWLAMLLVPNHASWFNFSDGYSGLIGVKLLLLALTAALAVDARLRLIPNLTAERLPALALRIRAVTLLSILFLIDGALLRTGGI